MILTLGCIALIIFAVILAFISDRFCYYTEDFFDIVAFLCGLVGAIGLFICILLIIIGHAGVDCRIQKNQVTYESLCERLEVIDSDYEDVSKSDVIRDIAEWNSDVYSVKYWSENPWTNWFYAQREADALQYIEK